MHSTLTPPARAHTLTPPSRALTHIALKNTQITNELAFSAGTHTHLTHAHAHSPHTINRQGGGTHTRTNTHTHTRLTSLFCYFAASLPSLTCFFLQDGERPDPDILQYDLFATVAHVRDPRTGGNLVSHIQGMKVGRTPTHARACARVDLHAHLTHRHTPHTHKHTSHTDTFSHSQTHSLTHTYPFTSHHKHTHM